MTTTDVMPSVEVAAPAVTPAPFGLFSLGFSPTPVGRWTDGAWWIVNGCNQVGTTFGTCTVDDEVPALDPTVTCGIAQSGAFTVYAKSDLSMGGQPVEDRRRQARDALTAGEQQAVESMLWFLLDAAVGAATATESDVRAAIARAESLVRKSYGGTPVLHLSTFAAASVGMDSLRVEGDRLLTFLGSRAVAGSGYDSGDADGDTTVFATGGMVIIRGDVFDVGEVYNRETNQIDALVERTYVVGWDCTAVRVAVA